MSGATIAGTARFCHYSRRNCRCTGLRLRPALDGGGRRQRLGGAGSAMTLPLSRDPLPSGSFFAVEHPQVALACPGCPHDPVPLRCHLLIGPPASGKTTLARDLAPLLRSEFGEHALELSTDAIRAELFGDAAVQGPWDEIRSVMLQRLQEAALLSADQLLEVHDLLKASMERLSDASQKPLLLKLEERLRRTGLLDGSAPRRPPQAAGHWPIATSPRSAAAPWRPASRAKGSSERFGNVAASGCATCPICRRAARASRPATTVSGPGRCSCSSTTSAGIWPSRSSQSASPRG